MAMTPDERRARARELYKLNPDRHREASRRYALANPEKVRESNKRSKAARRDRIREVAREWARNNKAKVLSYARKQRLKQDVDFDGIFAAQGHVCAICGSPKPDTVKTWHVDHDHKTGRIRGVLCHRCNLGLGNFRDNQDTLRKAIEYLMIYEALPLIHLG